jgi:outer membrane protein insertion porin family
MRRQLEARRGKEQMLRKRYGTLVIITILIVATMSITTPAAAQDENEGTSRGLIIKAIEIRGNDIISDREILSVMKGRAGDEFSANILFDDLKAIEEMGYFRTTPTQLKEPLEGGVKIVIIVEENPLFAGFEAEIVGVPVHTPEEIKRIFLTKYARPEGQIINNNNLTDGYIAIERLYRDDGYTAATITSAEIGDDGWVRIVIHEGIIHAIKIEGLHKTKDHVILRELHLQEGDIFNAVTLRKDLQDVYNLQLFQDIEVKFDLTPEREVDLIIDVEEARTGQLGFGAGYSTEDGFLATFSYSELNFRGVGQRLTGNAQIGGPDPDYIVSFSNPRIDKRNTSFSIEGFTQNTSNRERSIDDPDIFTRYTTGRKGGSAGVIYPLGENLKLNLNLRFLTGDIEVTEGPPLQDVSEFARRGLIDGTSNAFSARLTRDTRDFIFDPSRGSRVSVGTTMFGGLLGGDFDALKYEAEYSRYFLLSGTTEEEFTISPTRFRRLQVFAFRLLAGASSGDLSLMDRFEVGGAMSLRGSDIAVQTGDKALLFNAEYRFPVITNLSGAVFFDSGTASPPGESLNLDNLVNCVGGGIRYHIPFFGVAPLRLEYGYDMTNGEGRFVFGFGQLF